MKRSKMDYQFIIKKNIKKSLYIYDFFEARETKIIN